MVFEHDGSVVPAGLTFCTEPDLGETVRHSLDVPWRFRLLTAGIHAATALLGDWVWSVLRLFVK